METKIVECKQIDVLKTTDGSRTFSKEFAVKLSDSVKTDGLQNAIVVRPNPASKGRYILVSGKHRLYATKNVLKEQFIRCTVIEDMDAEEAEIAAVAENLYRNPLNKAQQAVAIKKWHSHWLAKLPVIEPKAIAAPAPVEPTAIDQTDQLAPEPVAPVADPAVETAFNDKVAAITGQSAVTVRRSKAIANAFTADQLEVFVQMGINQTDMLTIAKIKDVGQRAEVVALIASGMVAEDAIKEVTKDKAPSRYNNGGAEADTAKATVKSEKEPELTDDEWFEANCGEKAAMLGSPAKFKSDALLFRKLTDLRHAFRVKGKKFLVETKKASVTGPFFNLVNRVLSIAHPKDWLLCPECKGQGTVTSEAGEEDVKQYGQGFAKKSCVKCYAGGFLLKTETYL